MSLRKAALPLLLSLLICGITCLAHDETLKILCDTDAGLDDLRALTLLLSMEHVEIVAITTSDGVCDPELAAEKVCQLLSALEIYDIPVIIGPETDKEQPAFGGVARSTGWGDACASEIKTYRLHEWIGRNPLTDDSITVLAFGPLTTVNAMMASTAFNKEQLSLLWYGNPKNGEEFNHARNPLAWQQVSSQIEDIIVFGSTKANPLNSYFLRETASCYNPFANHLTRIHKQKGVHSLLESGHFSVWDEMLPLWLNAPELFSLESAGTYQVALALPAADLQAEMIKILRNAGGRRQSVLFEQFPYHSEFYSEDLSELAGELIALHGNEEFRLVVMTCELHRHLGIYSIAGAKMGLYARELLAARLDEVRVHSLIGLQPPFSCLNDGLQISTGATLGQGTITVSEEFAQAGAVFSTDQKTVKLTLKPEYLAWVKAEIQQAIQKHGNLTPAYWKQVRALALRCWKDWHRSDLFNVEWQ